MIRYLNMIYELRRAANASTYPNPFFFWISPAITLSITTVLA
jgi:hypothetical protein